MKVCIDSDETGHRLKVVLAWYVEKTLGHQVTCLVGPVEDQYPDVAHGVAKRIARGQFDRGIIICGTGLGVAMVANKVRGVYAGTCHDEKSARRLASSNNAQIICLGAEVISDDKARKVVKAYLETEFIDRPNAKRMRELEAVA